MGKNNNMRREFEVAKHGECIGNGKEVRLPSHGKPSQISPLGPCIADHRKGLGWLKYVKMCKVEEITAVNHSFYHDGAYDDEDEIVIAMTMLILTLGSALLRHQR